MSEPTRHFGTHTGTGLRAPSFVAEVLSYPADTPLEFTVRKARNRKTTPQNNYLHLLLSIAARALNEGGYGDGNQYTIERVKELLKQERVYPVFSMAVPGGEVKEFAKDTRELDKEEMSATIDNAIAFFAMYGIVLPAPDEQQTMKL